MNIINAGLMLMLYGIIGVFTVLILFYFSIIIMRKLFPAKDNENN